MTRHGTMIHSGHHDDSDGSDSFSSSSAQQSNHSSPIQRWFSDLWSRLSRVPSNDFTGSTMELRIGSLLMFGYAISIIFFIVQSQDDDDVEIESQLLQISQLLFACGYTLLTFMYIIITITPYHINLIPQPMTTLIVLFAPQISLVPMSQNQRILGTWNTSKKHFVEKVMIVVHSLEMATNTIYTYQHIAIHHLP